MRNFFIVTSLAFATLLLFQAAAFAEIVITTADGNDGADSFVQYYSTVAARANCNMGGQTSMQTKNAGIVGGDQLYRKCYIRFDISSIDLTELIDATFELTLNWADNQIFNVYGLIDGHANEAWEEGTSTSSFNVLGDSDPTNDNWLTWNNAPANDTANSINLTEAMLLGTFAGNVGDSTVGISGGSLLNFLQADTNGLVTLMVTRDTHDPAFGGASHWFFTKENGDPDLAPTLLLETTPVPEPNTFLLLLGMATGWMIVRRK